MRNAYIVTGEMTDDRTVRLDEALPVGSVKVRVVVEPISPALRRPIQEVLAEIYRRQEIRGHQPPTKEEVDAYLRTERDSWEE